MTAQRYEIEAWLGDDHGLTDEQVVALMREADEIADRYPDPDDGAEREAALITTHQLLTGAAGVIDELAGAVQRARVAERRALAGLQQAALMLIPAGADTQAGFARRAGVDRMTVRDWLGLRERSAGNVREPQ